MPEFLDFFNQAEEDRPQGLYLSSEEKNDYVNQGTVFSIVGIAYNDKARHGAVWELKLDNGRIMSLSAVDSDGNVDEYRHSLFKNMIDTNAWPVGPVALALKGRYYKLVPASVLV